MEEVPIEVLIKILSWLPEDDLRKMASMNERMKSAINEAIGFTDAMGERSMFMSAPRITLDWPEKVVQRGVSTCWIGDLTEKVHDPSFRFPKILKQIYFEGRITQVNFEKLLYPLAGLQHLTLHMSVLASDGVEIGQEFFSSCILKSLSLSCKNSNQALEWSGTGHERIPTDVAVLSNMARFQKNFRGLMTNLKSNRLTELLLSFAMSPSAELETTALIIGCISRNGSTLKIVQVYWERAHEVVGNNEDQTATGEPKDPSQEIWWAGFRGIFLKRFSFAFCERSTNASYPLWMELIRRQENLQELFYLNRSFKDTLFLTNVGPSRFPKLSGLKKTLIHLNACVKDENDPNWNVEQHSMNLGVFEQFPTLTHLLLRGEVPIAPLEKPGVKNVPDLPKLISIISIRDISMSRTDASAILGLGQLKRLRLLNIGFTGNFGMPFLDLTRVLHEKRLEEFEFKDAVNLESVTQNGEIFLALLFDQLRRINKMHFVLGQENGNGSPMEYYIKIEDMFEYGSDFEHLRANDICNIVFR